MTVDPGHSDWQPSDSQPAPAQTAAVDGTVSPHAASQSTKAAEPQSASEPPAASPSSGGIRLSKSQRENLQIVVIAVVLATVLRLFIAEPRYIPSDSMVPTLEVGDRLVVEKVSYGIQPPATGDIIVFDPPPILQEYGYDPDKAFIKRVIGTPGDVVSIHGGTVYLNQQPLVEPYIAEPPAYEMPAIQVPANQFFVMGDNRNNSNDSHVWGFLPRQNIIGRAIFRFFPFNRIGSLLGFLSHLPK